MSGLDLAGIKQSGPTLVQIAGAAVKLKRVGKEWLGCCPFHADRSPSFTIFSGGARFKCFGCSVQGDVLDFLQLQAGVGLRDAAAMLSGGNLPVTTYQPAIADTEPKEDRGDEARDIWRNASPISGTPAETYLRRRGLWLNLPDSLRFARLRYGKRGPMHPCLIALVASVDNKAIGIQRTYLTDGGGKAAVPKPKLSLGSVRGGAIRLAPGAVKLMVCEGLEDGLTLQQELGCAVWVAAGASMLPSMRIPEGVASVVIGADGDEPGERSAQDAARAFARPGRQVRIIRPLDGHKDFNDELRGVAR
ncbi:Toprim domain-containing protein [Sphingomonas antarctica]|uniref:DUF7146 domain-containing protein n=1 Tax=Sphingomonas antarctica TaxID=2040274 RepID=UPI0039E9D9B2